MTDKYYVVMEVGWEYDDNYYNKSYYSPYRGPVKIFTDEVVAEHFCAEKNLEYLQTLQPQPDQKYRNTQLRDYQGDGGGIEYLLTPEGIQFLRDLGQVVDDYDWSIDGLNEEQLRMIVGCLVKPFYEVVEVMS